MATNVTFTSLRKDVENYLERGASVVSDETVYDQIPRLINAAERKIMQTLDLLGERVVLRDPAGFVAGVSVIAKPDRWRVTGTYAYAAGPDSNRLMFLYPRSYDYCRAFWPDDSQQAAPQFYADYDLQHFLIVPTPDASYPVELIAYLQPQLLDDENQTNFFTTYAPNLILYGALLEATPFLKDDERIQVWQSFFDREAGTMAKQDLQRVMDNTTERTRP